MKICAVAPIAGLLSGTSDSRASEGQRGAEYSQSSSSSVSASCSFNPSAQPSIHPITDDNSYWRFYINNKEVDSSRAFNEDGCLRWPFDGAKKGDVCMVKSPKILRN